MTTQNEEVNTDSISDDEVLTEDGLKQVAGEETKTPSPSSEEDKSTEESEDETTEPDGEAVEEATDESVEQDSESEEPVVEATIEAKVVDGESPRERALRLEVQRVKEINRGLRGKKLLGDAQPMSASQPAELSPEDKQALEAFDPEAVANMEKLLPVLAKKLGFVKKDDFSKDQYQGTSQDVLDAWLEDHPDYLPENDKGDILFNRLKDEMSLFQKPANPKGWVKILNRAHNEIMGITTKPKESAAQVQAKQEKIKVASHGPASVSSPKTQTRVVSQDDQELRALAEKGGLKGFSQEEIDEMFG